MKINSDNKGFEGCLPSNRIAMRIENSAKMFEILSSGIYKDKIAAVIREYCCNAHDAHIAAGNPKPFTVQLPNQMDPTFAVIDNGTGVDPEKIGEIFWTYGHSTKTEDQNQIGALGLGSKSAFAYTKSSFIVKNRYNGVEYSYMCFIDEKGEPSGSLVNTEETTEHNGITVEFAVRNSDIPTFYARYFEIINYWKNKPNVIGVSDDIINQHKKSKNIVVSGDNWYIDFNMKSPVAVMGGVAYPIEMTSMPESDDDSYVFLNTPIVIEFPMGELEFSSSRESLSYTRFTVEKIKEQLKKIKDDLVSSSQKKLSDSKNVFEFVKNYANINTLINNITYHLNFDKRAQFKNNFEDKLDTTFKGKAYNKETLKQREFIFESKGFQEFKIIKSVRVGRAIKNRSKLYSQSDYYFVAKKPIDCIISKSIKMKEGERFNFEWEPNISIKRRSEFNISDFEKVKAYHKSFPENIEIFCKNVISFSPGDEKCVIVFNDVGPSGQDRFKYFESNSKDNVYYLLADCHSKTDKSVALSQLESFSQEYGFEIVNLSSIEDDRSVEQKEKKIRRRGNGTITISTKTYFDNAFYWHHNSLPILINGVRHFEKKRIFNVSDLGDEVLYFYKEYSEVYDSPSADSKDFNNPENISLLHHLKVFDKYKDANGNLNIMVLNKGQIEWLKKKGVKLTSMREFAASITLSLSSTEKDDLLSSLLKSILSKDLLRVFNEKSEWYDSKSLFKRLVSREVNPYIFIKAHLNNMVNYNEDIKKSVNSHYDEAVKILSNYPLLKHLGNITKCDFSAFENYIDMVDAVIEQQLMCNKIAA